MKKTISFIDRLQRVALYIFLFSINFEVWDPFSTEGFFSISKLTGLIYFFTLIPQISYFTRSGNIGQFLKPLYLFFGLLTLVSFYNVHYLSDKYFNLSIFQNICLFLFLINHERKEPLVLEKGLLSFVLGSIVLALLFIAGIGVEYDSEGRATIFNDNENNVGLRMSISLIILALGVIQNRLDLKKLRYLLLFPMPMMIQVMFQTGSRIAVISCALAFAIGIILFKVKTFWKKIASFSIGILLFIYGWQVMSRSEVLLQRMLASYYYGNIAGRDIIWQELLSLIKDHPILGVGETGYVFFTETTFGRFVSPHNVILEVLCYVGIVGLTVYLIFLYQIIKKSVDSYLVEGRLLPMLLLLVIIGMALSGQILVVKIGWVIFSYIIGSSVFRMPLGKEKLTWCNYN